MISLVETLAAFSDFPSSALSIVFVMIGGATLWNFLRLLADQKMGNEEVKAVEATVKEKTVKDPKSMTANELLDEISHLNLGALRGNPDLVDAFIDRVGESANATSSLPDDQIQK